MLVDGGSLAHTRRPGDNAGMAGDDGRAQVQLDEDTLARRRVLGEDHPDTLASADGLAVSLRAVGGHPGTLTSAGNLAASVSHPGEYQAARELGEDTLARRRRVLGEDHPDTLAAAFQLVSALFGLGDYHVARQLNDDIIARRRRVLGDEHPETMMAGAFDLILRGLDIGGESPWMAALREASKRHQQEARGLSEDKPG
jgi:hypothetical protein